MMMILPKWKITYEFTFEDDPITLFISDSFINNVMRKAADIEFKFPKQPTSVTIQAVQTSTTNITTGVL